MRPAFRVWGLVFRVENFMDDLGAQAEMAEKEAQIKALRAHGSGRRALLPSLASSVASGVAACERRVAEEARSDPACALEFKLCA